LSAGQSALAEVRDTERLLLRSEQSTTLTLDLSYSGSSRHRTAYTVVK